MDAAETIFEAILANGWDGILEMKADQREESLHLDFKQKHNPGRPKSDRSDRKAFAEALSGFANADGGVLVFGVNAREGADGLDAVQSIEAIQSADTFRSTLEGLLPEMVQPAIKGIRLETIEDSSSPGDGVVVILVPRSESTPHMAIGSGQSYYRRDGRSFLPMYHHEVADMFGRRPHPVISTSISWELAITGPAQKRGTASIRVQFYLENMGRAIARFPCLTITVGDGWQRGSVFAEGFPNTRAPDGADVRFAGGGGSVLYPGDRINAGGVHFKVEGDATGLLPPDFELLANGVSQGSEADEARLSLSHLQLRHAAETHPSRRGFSSFGWSG